jgi:hypothetical protein
MVQGLYHFAGTDGFIVEQYNDRAPFASFLPGIAGVTGRPAWALYVNRGQAVASFGVRNKDRAFLEFYLHGRDGGVTTVEGSHLAGSEAEALRRGDYRRVDVVPGA